MLRSAVEYVAFSGRRTFDKNEKFGTQSIQKTLVEDHKKFMNLRASKIDVSKTIGFDSTRSTENNDTTRGNSEPGQDQAEEGAEEDKKLTKCKSCGGVLGDMVCIFKHERTTCMWFCEDCADVWGDGNCPTCEKEITQVVHRDKAKKKE